MRKLLLKLLAAASFLTLVPQAEAKELTFMFDIYSSGPMIYACNAGIRHQNPAPRLGPTGQICHLQQTPLLPQTACVPGSSHNCVCTGLNGGAYLMDFLRYQARQWNLGHVGNAGSGWSSTLVHGALDARDSTAYNTVVPPGGNIFGTRLDQVTFNLGSEVYGAEFFVDVCYRGPQIEYWNGGYDSANVNNGILAAVSVTDVTAFDPNDPNGTTGPGGLPDPGPGGVPASSLHYLNLSGLTSKAVLDCDLQGLGTYKWAHNGVSNSTAVYDTLDNDLSPVLLSTDAHTESSGGAAWPAGGFRVVTQTQQVLLGDANASGGLTFFQSNNALSPRFCRVRYYFAESNLAERKWQRHDARVVLKTKIEEAASE